VKEKLNKARRVMSKSLLKQSTHSSASRDHKYLQGLKRKHEADSQLHSLSVHKKSMNQLDSMSQQGLP
jgi:hypothetical protein